MKSSKKGSPAKILSQVLASQRSKQFSSPKKSEVKVDEEIKESESAIAEESRSLADQFEVISSSEIKDAIIEAGVPNHDEEQSEEEEEDGEEEEEESSDEEDEESEKEVSCRHHSKPQSA